MIVQLLWILETRFWCTILNALWSFSNPLRVKLLYRGLNIYIPSLKSFNKWWWRLYNVLIWQGAELFLLGPHNNVQETNWAISKQADYQFKQISTIYSGMSPLWQGPEEDPNIFQALRKQEIG